MKTTQEGSASNNGKHHIESESIHTKHARHLERARSNYFTFNRHYIEIMTLQEAVFLQDIINLFSLRKSQKTEIGEESYFLCTGKFLRKATMKWTKNQQERLLSSLKRKGFLASVNLGMPPKRWICVKHNNIENALDDAHTSKDDNESLRSMDNESLRSMDNESLRSMDNESLRSMSVRSTQKKDTKESHSRSQAHDGEISISPPKNGNGFFPKQRTIDHDRSDKFYAIVYDYLKKSQRDDIVPPDPQTGPSWFGKLRRKFPTETIDKVLSRYSEIIGGEFVPQAFCACSFYKKFPQILLALGRFNKEPSEQPIKVEQKHLDRATEIKRLLGPRWKGSEYDSARAISRLEGLDWDIDMVIRCWGYYHASPEHEGLHLPKIRNGEEWAKNYERIRKILERYQLLEVSW